MTDYSFVSHLLEKSEERLLIELGAEVLRGESPRVFHKPSPDRLLNAAQRWLRDNHHRLRLVVCDEWKVNEKLQDARFADDVVLVSSLADFLAALSFGVSPFVLACLLVKRGLQELCGREVASD